MPIVTIVAVLKALSSVGVSMVVDKVINYLYTWVIHRYETIETETLLSYSTTSNISSNVPEDVKSLILTERFRTRLRNLWWSTTFSWRVTENKHRVLDLCLLGHRSNIFFPFDSFKIYNTSYTMLNQTVYLLIQNTIRKTIPMYDKTVMIYFRKLIRIRN